MFNQLFSDQWVKRGKPPYKKSFDEECGIIDKAMMWFLFIIKMDIRVNSVIMELGAVAVLGKPTYALEEDKTGACMNVLIDEVITTPEELVKRLK